MTDKQSTYDTAGGQLSVALQTVRQRLRQLRWPGASEDKAPARAPEDLIAKAMSRERAKPEGQSSLQEISVVDVSGILSDLSGARRRIDELTDKLADALNDRAADAARAAASEAREFDLADQLKAAHRHIDTLTEAIEKARRPWWRRS